MEILSYMLGKKAGGGSTPTLQEKSVTITENGDTTISADTGYDGLSQVSITTDVPVGSISIPKKDVNFYDYDGTITNSYTKQEFLALTAMPENPTHTGLTSQGWNWSLSDAKSYVTNYDKLNVGQMYITDDGATRLYIHLEDGRLSPTLGFAVNGTAIVDWGDNTTSTITGTSISSRIDTQHTYSQPGDYVISISSESTIYLQGDGGYYSTLLWNANYTSYNPCPNRAYQNSIKRIELGNVSVDRYAFANCTSLESITIPSNTEYFGGNQLFSYCYSLKSITLPNNVTIIFTYSFSYCYSLESVSLPNSINTIYDNIFYECRGLSDVTLPCGIGSSSFSECRSLSSATIPNNMTYIPYGAFYNCQAISYFKLPSTLTSISSSAFGNCSSVMYYDFSNHTSVPTLNDADAFSQIDSSCKIIVPDSLYEDWISATNWSTAWLAQYIIKKSDWDNL